MTLSKYIKVWRPGVRYAIKDLKKWEWGDYYNDLFDDRILEKCFRYAATIVIEQMRDNFDCELNWPTFIVWPLGLDCGSLQFNINLRELFDEWIEDGFDDPKWYIERQNSFTN